MNEKRIIEAQCYYIDKLKKILSTTGIITLISALVYIISYFKYSAYLESLWSASNTTLWKEQYGKAKTLFWDLSLISMFILIPVAIISIILLIDYLIIRNTELIVTDKRVYGRSLWGKRVDLPLDSISAVGTTIAIFKGISISTSSGKILFLGIDNISDIHKEISKLLIDRQNTNSNNTPIQTSSNNNMDDIIKLKEMLDADIITQEEFDIKKKELLGL